MESFKVVNPIVKANNLSKEVNLKGSKLVILHQVSLEIKPGESVAIVGPSGAGKTTLLGLLAGLDLPSSGEVRLGGVDIYKLDEEARAKVRGKHLSFIFQNFYLLENLSALENVMLALELAYDPDARSKAVALLTEVGLEDRLDHYPRQLSGGEQQRVAIARAFVTRPAILFADEPTGNLDQATGDRIVDQIFALNRNFATTLVIVTHEPSLAKRCDRIITLQKGGIDQ
jgi:putative ABC transport system ATP-binding protein